jgi:hypothetical protein
MTHTSLSLCTYYHITQSTEYRAVQKFVKTETFPVINICIMKDDELEICIHCRYARTGIHLLQVVEIYIQLYT